MILKKLVKELVDLTPYTIIRKQKNDGFPSSSSLLHNTPEHMNELFGNNKFLKKYESLDRRKLYKFICSLFPKQFESIADFGCGPGFFLQYVSEKFRPKNIYGYEY